MPVITVGEDDYGEVYLCMPTFSDLPIEEQASVLTHECAHKYLGVRDTGYFALGCKETARKSCVEPKDSGTAGDDPATRLNNADAYACLVRFLAEFSSDDVATKAADFRGDNLKLEVGESFLHTKTGSPSRSTYKITGVPDNSGFMFRWRLVAGEKRFPLTSTRTHMTVLGFEEDVLEVFVDNDVRRLLSEQKIGNAKLRCDIRLYRSLGKVVAPVITKTTDISFPTTRSL